MEKRPNCTEDCPKYEDCKNRAASLADLIITVGEISLRFNITIDRSIENTLRMIDGFERGDIDKLFEPSIHCPDKNDLYLLHEGRNLLIERREAWHQSLSEEWHQFSRENNAKSN